MTIDRHCQRSEAIQHGLCSHRPVIFYKTESQGDFEQLSREVESAIGAAITEAAQATKAQRVALKESSNLVETDALKDRILLEILEGEMSDPDGLSAYTLKNALGRLGISEGLTSLAALSLQNDGLVERIETSDQNENTYWAYTLTQTGRDTLLSQYADIKRREEELQRARVSRPQPAFDSDLDDDVPF